MMTLRLLLASALLLTALPVAAAGPNDGVEALVRAAFADAPEMIGVAKCESGFRQFGPDGTVLRGGSGKGYLGVFQIGERVHAARALAQGHDLMTAEGNIAYAKAMHATQGTTPWKECVTPTAPPAAVPTASKAFSADLRLGVRHAEVARLQRLLNANGFPVAAAGPGSPGAETDLFGALTREAVRKFQCARGIACAGDERTTGYGRVGPKTRAELTKLAAE